MKKTKTIEVSACDKCAREIETWQCVGCEKDACRNCCYVFNVTPSRPEVYNPYGSSIGMLGMSEPPKPEFKAYFCSDCAKDVAAPALLRAGFTDTKVTGPRPVGKNETQQVPKR